jgi:hypothetical protein
MKITLTALALMTGMASVAFAGAYGVDDYSTANLCNAGNSSKSAAWKRAHCFESSHGFAIFDHGNGNDSGGGNQGGGSR